MSITFPKLWRRPPKSREQIQAELFDNVGPVEGYVTGSMDEMLPGGYEVNLIRMIEDHAPGRIELIERSIKQYQDNIVKLQYEANKLRTILKAVEHE